MIVQVDSGYYRFAEENGWDGAGVSLGRSLWDFVAGPEVRKLQRMLVRRARGRPEGIELGFRCDAPGLRRELDVRIVPSRSRRLVVFSTRGLSEHRREPQTLLDPAAPRDRDTIEMCSWCDRFDVGGEWVEVEEAATRLRLFLRERLPRISHGVCPACSARLLAA